VLSRGIAVPKAWLSGWVWCIAIAACNGQVGAPVCRAPQGSATAARNLAAADTSFAVAFYGPATAGMSPGSNVVMSPYSISAAMTMVDVGAAGATDAQIQSVLHLPGNGAALAPAYAALACEDETDGSSQGNQLLVANSLWGQQGKAFEASFLSVLSSGYGAPLQTVDFGGGAGGATATINQWVSNETQSMIPALLHTGDVGGSTRLVLVDAVYFRGLWDDGFDPKNTSPQPFTLSDGTTVSVPTMSGKVNLALGAGAAAGQAFSVYELPYKGGSLAMDFLVPGSSLSVVEANLTPDVLSTALASMSKPENLNLRLPKFSIDTRFGVATALAAMGMPDVFGSAADLSGMDGMKDLYLSTVVQEARIEVNEQGSVAAAATAAVVSGAVCSRCPGVPVSIAIDSPFLFLIRDTKNGSILFVGRVEDPRQGS
jgi:serpin B